MIRRAHQCVPTRPSVLLAAFLSLLILCLGCIAGIRAQSTVVDGDLQKVTFRREFKGSTPEYVEIAVRQDGAATADVRDLDDEPSPQEFSVGQALAAQIFGLAGQLHHFDGADLDIKKRVAYMGQKTLRWEKGAENHQAQYNFTTDAKAAQLQKIFENLAQQQSDLDMLEQRLRFDRLGINQALDIFEGHLNHGMLPQPERFLPVLDRIVDDSRLIELARQRARTMAARIRAGQSQAK